MRLAEAIGNIVCGHVDVVPILNPERRGGGGGVGGGEVVVVVVERRGEERRGEEKRGKERRSKLWERVREDEEGMRNDDKL